MEMDLTILVVSGIWGVSDSRKWPSLCRAQYGIKQVALTATDALQKEEAAVISRYLSLMIPFEPVPAAA